MMRPGTAIRASLWLHGVAAFFVFGVAIRAGATGTLGPLSATVLGCAVALLVLNHLGLTAAGLCPRCSVLGPNITHLPEAAVRRGLVALTIDDGPDPLVTPLVLDALRDGDARASFFLIARRAEQHPELVARIVREGHSVENHTWTHSHAFSFFGPRRFRLEIGRAQESLSGLTGSAPRFFRAPAGLRNPLLEPVLRDIGLPLVSWTRRGFDTVTAEPDRVLARLIGKDAGLLAAGDILLLHDGNAARTGDGEAVVLSVLPRLLAACARRGLRAVSLREGMSGPVGPDLAAHSERNHAPDPEPKDPRR